MTPNKDRRFISDQRISAYWHFPQDRFDTSKHPIIANTDKPRFKLACLISHQENQRLNGLINTLQVEEREAIRIALFECCLRDGKELKLFIDQAKTITKARGHTNRNLQLTARATEIEKKNAQAKAKELGITEKEMIRLAIIWLGATRKDESVKRLTNSKRLSDIDCARQWNKEKKDKPRTNKAEAFVTAREVGLAKKVLQDLRAQPEREIIKAQLFASGVLQLLKNKYPHYKTIKIERDAYYKELNEIIDEQILDSQSSVIQEIAESRGIPEDEPILKTDAEIFLLMHSLDIEYDLAKLFYEDEQKEKEKIEALSLVEQLSHYKSEIERIESYKVAREQNEREKQREREEKRRRKDEEFKALLKEREESSEGSTFLYAVNMEDRLIDARLDHLHVPTPGTGRDWRTLKPVEKKFSYDRDGNLLDEEVLIDSVDSWQIDDGPLNTLI